MASVAERGASLVAFALVSLSAMTAHAQPTSAAQMLFEEGRRLVAAGDVQAGCAKLAESQRLDPAGGTLMNLAACHERLGKTATAWAEFNDALAQAKRDGRDDRIQETTRRIDALAPRLARLTVVVTSAAAGLEVKVDGTALGSASWGTPIPVDPGEHEVRASAPGTMPWSTRVTITEKDATQATVPPLARMPTPPRVVTTETPTGMSGRRIVAFSAGGVGVVALGLGTYFGIVAIGKKNDSDRECGDRGCTQRGAALLHDADNAAWVSNIAIGVGIAALAAATILFLTSPDGKPAVRATAGGLGGTW